MFAVLVERAIKLMIEVHCEGQGSLRIRPKNQKGGNYESNLYFSFGSQSLTSPVARDLLRVGQAAFLADRAFRRGTVLGQRTRRLTLVLPVEEPDRWSDISGLVGQLAEFASQDYWQFEFKSLRKARKQKLRPPLIGSDNVSINLFSNGLDSLCGVAAAFKRKEVPVLVSHSPPGIQHVRLKITALAEALGYGNLKPQFVNIRFRASDRDRSGRRNMFPERSRRTRPMLFLSMAGAVALELGISKIHINENGVLAINLPFESHLHGANASRHAHPETLRRFESLLKALWPLSSQPLVRNPFSQLTKAEEIRHLHKAKDMAERTITCEYAGQQMAMLINWLKRTRGRHEVARECGLCMPCLVRRCAMESAGLFETAGHYVFDARRTLKKRKAYKDAPLFRVVQENVKTLHEFSRKIDQMKKSEFALAYLSDLSLVPASAEEIGESTRATYRLYQRFAREFIDFIAA